MYNKISDTNNVKKLPLEFDAWQLFNFEDHEIIRLDLIPGQVIEKHKNNWRILFYVLEGAGDLVIDGTKHTLKSHQMIAVHPGSEREWINNGDNMLKLLVIKTILASE